MTLEQAALLPPYWDTPENKKRIYDCFEQLQLHLRCGKGSRRQTGSMLTLLGQLTKAAKKRKDEYVARSAFLSGGEVGGADDVLPTERASAVLDDAERWEADLAGV